jgi:vacuolar-type H+-ATPase subunit I/STV1
MRRAILAAALLLFSSAAEATAQAQRGGSGAAAMRRAEQKADAARQARIVAEQKGALAKMERDKAFESRQAALQGEIDAVKSAAAAENRALTPQEDQRIAAISQRMEQMRANREAVQLAAQQERSEARRDNQRERERNQTMREDRCRIAGTHQNRIDRPRSGAGC